MIQIKLKELHLNIPEDDETWRDSQWEDAEDFHETLEKFAPPGNNVKAK